MIYGIVFIVILTGGLLAFVENDRARSNAYFTYLSLALPFLFFVAASRAVGVDADSPAYLGWYTGTISEPLSPALFSRDPAFALISLLVHLLGLTFPFVLGLYTAACMTAQMCFLRSAVAGRWLPLGFFLVLSRYFIAHEMTQIRASVAIPLLSIAILQFSRGHRKQGWILYSCALVFHLSALIALPVCLAVAFNARFTSRRWLQWIAVAAAVLHFAFERLSGYLALFERLGDYVSGDNEVEGNSLLSVYFLFRLALLLFVYFAVWGKLQRTGRIIVICSATGLALEAALSANSSFGIRAAELFGMFDVAAALLVLHYLRPRAVLLYSLFLLGAGANFFRSSMKIIQPYHSVLFAKDDKHFPGRIRQPESYIAYAAMGKPTKVLSANAYNNEH